MAKSMRSNRRRQLRSQHRYRVLQAETSTACMITSRSWPSLTLLHWNRTSLAKTTAFKVKDATKQDLIDRIAAVGAAQRQQVMQLACCCH